MTEVIVIFPGGSRISTTLPGRPRRGETVSVRWGASSTPTRYAVQDVVWDLNELRVLVYLAVGSARC